MSSPLHVETEWNPEFERDIPVRIVCNACGKARALSTPTAVLIESFGVVYDPEDGDSTWVRQSEDFARTIDVARSGGSRLSPARSRSMGNVIRLARRLAPALVSKQKAQQAGHWKNIPGFGAD